jgi:hypothetical protein
MTRPRIDYLPPPTQNEQIREQIRRVRQILAESREHPEYQRESLVVDALEGLLEAQAKAQQKETL